MTDSIETSESEALPWPPSPNKTATAGALYEAAAPEMASARYEVATLIKERDGWQERAKWLQRDLHLTQCDNTLLRAQASKDVWVWQGDGTDNLESMGNRMVVAIFAKDFRTALAVAAAPQAPAASAVELADADILALNAGERFFSESPSKFPEAGFGTQYHAGRPGVLQFARAVLALGAASPQAAPAQGVGVAAVDALVAACEPFLRSLDDAQTQALCEAIQGVFNRNGGAA
jgi:hypothetical protein